ncbi:MAG: hypothetical protein KGN84_15785 [Acidobacteriota bacterium]|nr:hypothetical protein [Acidobacteriota bacterium]
MKNRGARRVFIGALLGAGAVCVFAVTVAQPQMKVFLDGDYLRISVAPHLNFLSGRTLERLKDGDSVAFVGQLTITPALNSVSTDARSVARFALSYDIWEQKFAVVKIGERPDLRRSISHLSAEATENWCLENLAVDRSLLPADRSFYVQLDLRADESRGQGIVGESGLNITQLIDVFRSPAKGGSKPVHLSSGPIRLSDLRKTA